MKNSSNLIQKAEDNLNDAKKLKDKFYNDVENGGGYAIKCLNILNESIKNIVDYTLIKENASEDIKNKIIEQKLLYLKKHSKFDIFDEKFNELIEILEKDDLKEIFKNKNILNDYCIDVEILISYCNKNIFIS